MKINIALASDDSYVPYMSTTMVSILKNAKKDTSFVFYILSNNISDENRLKIAELKKIRDFEIKYFDIDIGKKFANMPVLRHSVNSYFRLLLPQLLPEEERILYFDSDLIILKDLQELYNTDFEGKTFCSALDYYEVTSEKNIVDYITKLKKDINVDIKNPYFNSGVILMNLDKIKHCADLCGEGLVTKANEYTKIYKKQIKHSDQDILNSLFQNDVKIVEPKWNYQVVYEGMKKEDFKEEYKYIYNSKRNIIHYTSYDKPWNEVYLRHLQKEWVDCFKLTPFYDGRIVKYKKNPKRDLLSKFIKKEKNGNKRIITLLGLIKISYSKKRKKYCPICKKASYFKPFGVIPRDAVMCPKCGSLERHRFFMFLYKKLFLSTKKEIKILHIAPEKALNECYRVLTKSGKLILSIPIFFDLEKTFEDEKIKTPEDREKFYGQGDHVRKYGKDVIQKFSNLSNFNTEIFNSEKLFSKKDIKKYGLAHDILFVMKKNLGSKND